MVFTRMSKIRNMNAQMKLLENDFLFWKKTFLVHIIILGKTQHSKKTHVSATQLNIIISQYTCGGNADEAILNSI